MAATTTGLYRLDGDDWRLDPAWKELERYVTVEVDSVTGVEWWSTGDELYRWDGEQLTTVPEPPIGSPIGDIVATGDGTVWASGMSGYTPDVGGLLHYRDDSGTWEAVRPLGATDNVPADGLAPTPDGGLWAKLAEWSKDWQQRQEVGEPFVQWAFARLDRGSDQWTVYRDDLPSGYPGPMAADNDALWFAQGAGLVADIEPFNGVVRFDGETTTTYLESEVIAAVGVAEDGTVWVSVLGEPGIRQVRVHN